MDLSPQKYVTLKKPPERLIWRANGGSLGSLKVQWSTFANKRRKVVTTRPHRMVGLIPAYWRADHAIEHESQLEADFIKQVLLVPGVWRVNSQPKTFVFSGPASEYLSRQSYTPDYLIQFDDGVELLIEVRHSSRISKDIEFFKKFGALVSASGISYCVVTEREIQGNQNRLDNAGLLYRYAREANCAANVNLKCGQKVTFNELLEHCNDDLIKAFNALARGNFDWNPNISLNRPGF